MGHVARLGEGIAVARAARQVEDEGGRGALMRRRAASRADANMQDHAINHRSTGALQENVINIEQN
eukprot:2565375-Pyramimonas_sp.AAC.1